jgi:hypothetical protein
MQEKVKIYTGKGKERKKERKKEKKKERKKGKEHVVL